MADKNKEVDKRKAKERKDKEKTRTLGWGLAEKARRNLKDRKSNLDKAIDS